MFNLCATHLPMNFFILLRLPSRSSLFPYTTLFRSALVRKFAPVRIMRLALPVSVATAVVRSEEHTSELQSRGHLVCRLLLEKKNKPTYDTLNCTGDFLDGSMSW